MEDRAHLARAFSGEEEGSPWPEGEGQRGPRSCAGEPSAPEAGAGGRVRGWPRGSDEALVAASHGASGLRGAVLGFTVWPREHTPWASQLPVQ